MVLLFLFKVRKVYLRKTASEGLGISITGGKVP